MSASKSGLSCKLDGLGGQVVVEGVPLAVEQHAAQVQDKLGAVAPPAHAGAIEAQANEIADRALDGASPNIAISRSSRRSSA